MRLSFCLGAVLVLAACKPSSERYAQSVTVDLPPAVPVDSINLVDADAAGAHETAPAPKPLAMRPAPPSAPTPVPGRAEPRLVLASAATDPIAPAAGEPAPVTAAAETAPAAAASRPALSDATIARTLGRIGFSCGRVVSTSSIDEGGWRIDCSSGASYRASDRTGRMRFKRW